MLDFASISSQLSLHV